MRMVVGEVDETGRVNTIENTRLPVRLGQDVFSKGYLEEKTIQQLFEPAQGFTPFHNVGNAVCSLNDGRDERQGGVMCEERGAPGTQLHVDARY